MSTRTDLLAVHDELVEWGEAVFGGGRIPCPSVTFAGYYSDISIGDVMVWDSENGYADESIENFTATPTVELCIRSYKHCIDDMTPRP